MQCRSSYKINTCSKSEDQKVGKITPALKRAYRKKVQRPYLTLSLLAFALGWGYANNDCVTSCHECVEGITRKDNLFIPITLEEQTRICKGRFSPIKYVKEKKMFFVILLNKSNLKLGGRNKSWYFWFDDI